MAQRLGLSPNTVRNHIKNICLKTRVQSQTELREVLALAVIE